MSFDIFAALVQPGSGVTIHNVRLIDVQPAEGGHERLTIEHAGTTCELVGGGRWNAEYSHRDVGHIGYVEPAHSFGLDLPEGACYFRAYMDQSLRRVPELDSADRSTERDGRAAEVVGWRCDSKSGGFRAPVGIIPGEDGRFVSDKTVAVTVRVPPEFVRECLRVQMTPEAVLRSFVGDLAGIQNLVACPRTDGFGSNGSDERNYADAWLQRAHGMNAINLDAVEYQEEQDQEKQWLRDDFAALLDDFESHGGKADELFAAVQALVEKQAGAAEAADE